MRRRNVLSPISVVTEITSCWSGPCTEEAFSVGPAGCSHLADFQAGHCVGRPHEKEGCEHGKAGCELGREHFENYDYKYGDEDEDWIELEIEDEIGLEFRADRAVL